LLLLLLVLLLFFGQWGEKERESHGCQPQRRPER